MNRFIAIFIFAFIIISSLSTYAQDKNTRRKNAIKYTDKGIESYAGDSLSKAIKMFDLAIREDSTYDEAYYRRGNAYFDQKDYTKAGHDFLWLANRHSRIADAYEKAGQIDTSIRKYAEALPFFSAAIALDSGQGSYYAARGISFFYMENYEKAVLDFERAIEMNYTSADIYSKMGYALLRTDDPKGAVYNFTKAIELNPNNIEDYANRGDALVALHQLDAAKSDLYIYISHDKSDYSVWYNLARAQYGLNEYDSAILSYKIVLKLKPGYGDTYFRMGLTYADKKDYKSAVDAFSSAIEQEPNGGYLYYNRAIAKAKLNDGSDYCGDLKKASDMGFQQALIMLKQVCE